MLFTEAFSALKIQSPRFKNALELLSCQNFVPLENLRNKGLISSETMAICW